MNQLPGKYFVMRYPKTGEIMHAGPVKYARNYGTDDSPDWYVEFTCTFCETHTPGAHYLKQQEDGYAWAVIEFRDSLIVGPDDQEDEPTTYTQEFDEFTDADPGL